jgi:hypothetical protein
MFNSSKAGVEQGRYARLSGPNRRANLHCMLSCLRTKQLSGWQLRSGASGIVCSATTQFRDRERRGNIVRRGGDVSEE